MSIFKSTCYIADLDLKQNSKNMESGTSVFTLNPGIGNTLSSCLIS